MLKNKFKISLIALLISANSFSAEYNSINSELKINTNNVETKIANGELDFFKNYLDKIENKNSNIFQNGKLNIITLLAISRNPNTYQMTRYALNKGLIDKSSYSGNELRKIAFQEQNFAFIKALNDHYSEVYLNIDFMSTNTYTDYQKVVKKEIYKSFINEKIDKVKKDEKGYNLLIKMILNGYNDSALALIKKNNYSVDDLFQKDEDGMYPILATSLSDVFGGNVELLSFVYNLNKELFTNELILEIIHASLIKDNFKIVYFLLSKSNVDLNTLSKLQRKAIKEYNALRVANILDKKISSRY